MKPPKPPTHPTDEQIPSVLSNDDIPVLQDIIATQNSAPEKIAVASTLKKLVDAAIDMRLTRLAEVVEHHFNTLEQLPGALTAADIGRELGVALRNNTRRALPAIHDTKTGPANTLQSAPSRRAATTAIQTVLPTSPPSVEQNWYEQWKKANTVQTTAINTNQAPSSAPHERTVTKTVTQKIVKEATTVMEKTYNPDDIEQRWYQNWEENNYFAPANSKTVASGTPSYCIMIPPPNVTGSLHMGHALDRKSVV